MVPYPPGAVFPPTCAAGTLLLSDPEGTPPLGLVLRGLKRDWALLKCNPEEAIDGPDSPQLPVGLLFQTNLKITAQEALQIEEPGVNSVQLNNCLLTASQALGHCLLSLQRNVEIDE